MPVLCKSSPTLVGIVAAPILALTLLAAPAAAQTTQQNTEAPPSTQSLENKGNCNSANTAEAATPPDRTSADGTAPGNTGSTGWTGGTGGAQIGTNPQGALPESKTWQPPTARGLDLAMALPEDRAAGATSVSASHAKADGC